MKAKKGQIIKFTEGSYDDYGVIGIYIVAKSFDDSLIKELVGNTEQTFFEALVREKYIREHKKGVVELHLGPEFGIVGTGSQLSECRYNLQDYLNEC